MNMITPQNLNQPSNITVLVHQFELTGWSDNQKRYHSILSIFHIDIIPYIVCVIHMVDIIAYVGFMCLVVDKEHFSINCCSESLKVCINIRTLLQIMYQQCGIMT